MKVDVVQHVHELEDDSEDVKFNGAYSTRQKAKAAVQRRQTQVGFREAPDGFAIDAYELAEDHWVEGYITVA